jgi:hypothetical protein
VLGRLLFRWRGVIGVLAFGVVFWLARPTFGSCLLGVPFLIAGLAVRFWASGYIGIEGRAREIGARQRLVSGPYRLLRHPLYIGNSLLVAGMLVALRPALWLGAVVLAGFIVEYGLIVAAEEAHLSGLRRNAKCRVQNAKGKMGDVEGGAEDKSEAKSQEPKAKAANGEQFRSVRAMCEWRTWVVTGVAWGVAVVKALVMQ